MKGNALKHLWILALLVLLSGCKTLNLMQDKREENLDNTLKAYGATVRWGYPGQAYNFLKKELSEKSTISPKLNNISVTDYKVIRPPTQVAENQAAQTVVISYIYDDQQVQKSLTDKQLWEYEEETQKWFRINPIPEYP